MFSTYGISRLLYEFKQRQLAVHGSARTGVVLGSGQATKVCKHDANDPDTEPRAMI